MANDKMITDLLLYDKESNSRKYIAFNDYITANNFSLTNGGSIQTTPFGRKSQIIISLNETNGKRKSLEYGIHVNRMRMICERIQLGDFSLFKNYDSEEEVNGLVLTRTSFKKNDNLKENESMSLKCIFSLENGKFLITLKEGIGKTIRDEINCLKTIDFRELESITIKLSLKDLHQLVSDVLQHINNCSLLNMSYMLQKRQIYREQSKNGVFKDCYHDLDKIREVELSLTSQDKPFNLDNL